MIKYSSHKSHLYSIQYTCAQNIYICLYWTDIKWYNARLTATSFKCYIQLSHLFFTYLHFLQYLNKNNNNNKSFHWLPVKVRSTYKIACLYYHCHNSTAPSYVTDMLHKRPLHTRNTRSSSHTIPLLNRPAHSKATLCDRSFSFASFSVWNSIPNDVRCAPSLSSFKSHLKTYLFRSVYKD